jgi:uncharacterized membrane protein YfcA
MVEHQELLIYIVTLVASALTLITGFGLATLLTPVFVLFYDVKLAILLVAIVHFMNNALKFGLFWKEMDLGIIKRFGLLSVGGAFIGAMLQIYVYSDALKIVLGVVLILLGVGEFLPKSMHVRLPKRIDLVGGFLSGLLGGLVGNQGAIRSAYLLNYAISKERFIATATVIALAIDVTRIPVYVASYGDRVRGSLSELGIVVLVAFAGTFLGRYVLRFITFESFRSVVALFVIVTGLALASNLL